MRLNTVEDAGTEAPDGELRNLLIEYPAGLAVNPTAVPTCSNEDFMQIEGDQNDCSDATAIGVAEVTASNSGPIAAGSPDFADQAPVYSLTPLEGMAGRIGFVAAGQPVQVELGIGDAPPYNGVARVSDLSQAALFYRARISIWGNPADPAHDLDRGQCAFSAGSCPSNVPVRPFLTLPRSCGGPLATQFEALSWDDPAQSFATAAPLLGLAGCAKLAFLPALEAQPTTALADSPSGLYLSFDFHHEGLLNSAGVAQSETKQLTLTLPEGMIVNPWADENLGVCTPAQLAQETLHSAPGGGCPTGSAIGAAEIETPLLPSTPLEGRVFAGQSDVVYIVIKDAELGILVKEVGEIEHDPLAEQLRIGFDYLPQLPISHLGLRLDEDLLLTPPECDDFPVTAEMAPWSAPGTMWLVAASFPILAGPDGGACPSGREQAGDSGGSPVPSSTSLPLAAVPPPVAASAPRKRRVCPRGKRRVRGKARCVRRRCRRARAGRSVRRRCHRPQSRRRR